MGKQVGGNSSPITLSDILRDRPKDELPVPATPSLREPESVFDEPVAAESVPRAARPRDATSASEILSLRPGEVLFVRRDFLLRLSPPDLADVNSFIRRLCVGYMHFGGSGFTIERSKQRKQQWPLAW